MSSSSASDLAVGYGDAVTPADLKMWESELEGLFARLRPLFYRTESKKHAQQYVRGLLSPLARKNGWTIAEHVGEPEPTPLQRFLNLSPWDVDALVDLNREYAMEHLADPGAILVADPTGFPKKGTKSVGVQRQYTGTLGRIDNCQIATFLGYVTPGRDRILLDRRLYLPKESWIADPARCAAAGVPPEVTFKTRPVQVREMIESARVAGVGFAWFTADEEFGQNPGLCDYLETSRIPYVMAVPKTTQFTDTNRKTVPLNTLTGGLRRNAWQRRACGIGSKGHRVYDWALIDSADPDHQYLIRRSIDDGELAFYHCYTPNRSYSAGVECWWQPGSGGEQLVEGVEFVEAQLGDGVQVGLDDGEVDESLQGAPGASGGALLDFDGPDGPFGFVVREGHQVGGEP